MRDRRDTVKHPPRIPSLSDRTPTRNNSKNCNRSYQGPHPDATDGDISCRGDAGPPQVMMTRSAIITEHTEMKPRNVGHYATTPGLTVFSPS
nr:hypothetical protein HmN_000935400 [Hymenolepis microstoma]